MTTTFTLTTEDFARLQKIIAKRFRRRSSILSVQFGLRILVWLCIGTAGATYARLMREYPEISQPLTIVGALLVAALLAVIAMPYVSQGALRNNMLAPNGAFLSPQTIYLSFNGVEVSSATATTKIPWSGVLAREEDDVSYYLFIDMMQALIIPRAVISSFIVEFEQYTAHLRNAA